MTIIQILPYGKTRCKVLLNEDLVLLFYKSEISRLGLKEGAEISEESYRTNILPILKKRARERLVGILEDSDKSENELRRKLKEGFYPKEVIDEAIEWCKAKHYIDDERYIRNYLRYHSEGKSRTKLKFDLMGRGLDKELIEACLEDTEIDESAQVLAELKRKKYDPAMDDKEKQKIIASLARKGYSWNTIQTCIHDDYLLE